MSQDIRLPRPPELPKVLNRFVLSSLSKFKADEVRHEIRKMMRDYARKAIAMHAEATAELVAASTEMLRVERTQGVSDEEHEAAVEHLDAALTFHQEEQDDG